MRYCGICHAKVKGEYCKKCTERKERMSVRIKNKLKGMVNK